MYKTRCETSKLRGVLAVFVTIGAAAALSACSTTAPLVLHETVGPAHLQAPSEAPHGHLIVYTVSYVGSEDADIERLVHSSYEIRTPDGKLLRAVANRAGLYDSEPSLEDLPPGRYEITADAYRIGRVTVPVAVELNKTTVVDLDEGYWSKSTVAANAVTLPNGAVVGSRADP